MIFLKKKFLFTILLILFGFFFYFNSNICNFKRFINSSINFGTFYTVSHCGNFLNLKIKGTLKSLIIKTKFEIYARSFLKSGNYELINEKILNQLLNQNKTNSIKPEKIIGVKKTNNYNTKLSNFRNWQRSHGGDENLKFADYSGINLENINNLKLLWKFKEKGNNFTKIQLNPIYKNNILYFASGNGKIIALDSRNGKKIWSLQSIKDISTRGVIFDNDENYIYVPIEKRIFKINSETGVVEKKFGKNGSIGVNTRSAPIFFRNNVCAAQLFPASIKCYNKKSGKLNFDINIHPNNKTFSQGGTIWSNIAFDKQNEIVYAVTGNPRPALIGLTRTGTNKNANSIVAVDLNNRKILWTHQDVLHDLWDYDVSAPPVITNVGIGEKIFPGLVVISKIGNIYLFNRITGESYFDINYKKVPKSQIKGEFNSSYQLNLKEPEPLQNLNFSKNDFNEKGILKYSKKIDLNHFSFGEFIPPKLGGEVVINGLHGGVSFTGFSINPKKHIIFAPVNNIPHKLKLELKTYSTIKLKNNSYDLYMNKCASCHGNYRNGTFEFKPSMSILDNISDKNTYKPSLVGHSIYNKNFNELFSSEYINSLHNNKLITKEEELLLKELFKNWDQLINKNSEFFYNYNWSTLLASKKIPANKPPWGEIVAVDLITGEHLWKKPIGKLDGKLTGTEINGGLATNSGDILVATGTYDNLVYFVNQKNGNILNTFELDSPSSAPPIIFKDDIGEKISVVSGMMNYTGFDQKSETTIYTFGVE